MPRNCHWSRQLHNCFSFQTLRFLRRPILGFRNSKPENHIFLKGLLALGDKTDRLWGQSSQRRLEVPVEPFKAQVPWAPATSLLNMFLPSNWCPAFIYIYIHIHMSLSHTRCQAPLTPTRPSSSSRSWRGFECIRIIQASRPLDWAPWGTWPLLRTTAQLLGWALGPWAWHGWHGMWGWAG